MKRNSKKIQVGNTFMGGDAPVTVQSMLSVHADDVQGNVRQAVELEQAGCQILRVSIPHKNNVQLIPAIKEKISIPLVADIHFDYRLALESIDAGVDKIRLNPGNIGGEDRVKAVVHSCQKHNVPIRIGVNGGSLEKAVLEKYGSPTPEALVESAMYHVRLLEKYDFDNIAISIKSSHVPTMVHAYQLLAEQCIYPLHLGVTEAGTWRNGLIKNAMGIGALLLQGIGDTLRVSLTADPVKEIQAGFDILRAAGLPSQGVEVISCPTCGRTNINVEQIAQEVEDRLQGRNLPIKIAVMGCVVNGLGEGKEADIGIAGGVDSAILFSKGVKVKTLRGDLVQQLLQEIDALYPV